MKTVVANGCFDLLHAGHLHLLNTARKFGDRLIVLLNSDASVRLLKGPSRPIWSQEQRRRALLALDCVDAVIVFDDPTPADWLLLLRPDVLVKGSGSGPTAGSQFCGRIEYIDLLPGWSTTTLSSQADKPVPASG